ncbi:hypothetical protein [Streptomyces sp. HC307]|uniref:hypothetical protein n=1 Tax=Streptomyces flavusporus TaxID=3385496 RepID=UPI0039176442
MLVDVETHQLVDVLPDRNSETLTAWLRDHTGAEIVCPHSCSPSMRKAVGIAASRAGSVWRDGWRS